MENYSYTATLPDLTDTPKFFWLNDTTTSIDEWASHPGQNYDNKDHMVTFRIIGNQGDGYSGNDIGNFVIAWEDLPYGGNYVSDRDFNDLVVEINATPEPATMILLGFGLAGLAALRRKFNR